MSEQRHLRRIVLLAALLSLALLPAAPGRAALAPRSPEFQVNTAAAGEQKLPAAAMDADGDFVISWGGDGADGFGVYARRFGSDGAPRGDAFAVNTAGVQQGDPAVAMDADGDFVVTAAVGTWGLDGDNYGIYARRYAADGTPRGAAFQVNTTTAGAQDLPAVAMDTDGDFVVVWQSAGQDGDGLGIVAQRYAADGTPQGGEFQVNTFTSGAQGRPAVAMDADGDFVVVWQSAGQDGDGFGIYARRYGADGAPQGGEVRVNTGTVHDQWEAAVAMDAGGDFVVSWSSFEQEVGTRWDNHVQRYGADGSPRGGEFRTNSVTIHDQGIPSLAMDADGDFVVSWLSYYQDGDLRGIYARRYAADGAPRGDEFQVNAFTANHQHYAAAAMDANGDFVISWQSEAQDGDMAGIFARRFAQAPDLDLGAVAGQPVVILENGAASIPFTVSSTGAAPAQLVLTVETITNTDLLPPGSLALGGSGTSRTLSITPARTSGLSRPSSRGSATVRLTASDPLNGTSTSVELPVEVQAPPWLALLYLAGDDTGDDATRQSLSLGVKDILGELQAMPYNPAMRLVVLADLNGSGDSKVYVRDPAGLTEITAAITAAWASAPAGQGLELDTGSRTTLSNYLSWATSAFPGYQHTFLALMDHGGGWAPDPAPGLAQPSAGRIVKSGGWRGMSMDLTTPGGTSLSTSDTGLALRSGRGGGPLIDVVFFDACLMGMIESAYEVHDQASYLVAAQNLLFQEEKLRSYSAYLGSASLGPTTTPEQLATALVATYNTVSVYGDPVSQAANPYSIAAINLAALPPLAQQVEALAQALQGAYADDKALYDALVPAYTRAQKFDYDSDEQIELTDGYVDLAHLADQLQADQALPEAVRARAGEVASAARAAVLAHRAVSGTYYNGRSGTQRWNFDHSSGLSIYAPLGEQDWRPTSMAEAQLPSGCLAASDDQLAYYNTAQLRFVAAAPGWAQVLTRTRASVPRIHAPCLPVGAAAPAAAAQIDSSPFYTPGRVELRWAVMIPLVAR